MKIPEYITKQEVQRICQELGIKDWTKLTESQVSLDDAKIIQVEVGSEAMSISTEAFKQGLDVELEHGIQFTQGLLFPTSLLVTMRILNHY